MSNQGPIEPLAGESPPGAYDDAAGDGLVRDDQLQAGLGEPLHEALDVARWHDGTALATDVERVEQEVADALRQQDRVRQQARAQLLGEIDSPERRDKPKGAGVVRVTPEQLQRVQSGLLFAGAVDACVGTAAAHDTLPVTVAQVGVCLVSYLGSRGAWGHRLFYRDLRLSGGGDPVGEMLEVLHRRSQRTARRRPGHRDQLSELARRGIRSYAERAVLLERSDARWVIGRGHPAPYELITGSGSMQFLRISLEMLRRLILDRRRFVFIASRPQEDRLLMSIGDALMPLEFAIVDRDELRTRPIVEEGNLRGEHRTRAVDFVNEVIDKLVVGVYRTGLHSPPQIFYAHEDFAEEAALVAMADSMLQPFRSYPTLLDLSGAVVDSLFGPEAFEATVQNAYARGGQALRFAFDGSAR
jgi:hypothetical protein